MLQRARILCAAAMLALAGTAIVAPKSASAQQATILPPAETCFQAQTGLSGMIGALGTLTGGSGGTSGTYANVPLTGGSGSGATANMTVSGGAVTAVTILNPGTKYQPNDSLSAASGNIGNVIGFSVVVNSVSINSSLAGGSVAMYVPGTTTPKQTWQNAAQTILNTNPIILDSNGCGIIFGSGAYRQIVYDSLGNEIYDQLTYGYTSNPFWASLASGTANAITVTDASFSATDGQAIQFVAANTNTGAATLTPSGTGTAVPIEKNSPSGPVALTGGEIVAGNLVTATYYATGNYFLIAAYPQISAAMQPVVSASSVAKAAGLMQLAYGQVYFTAPTNGGTTLQVCPTGGAYLTIAGADYAVPSSCITANITSTYVNGAPSSSLVANTLYYAYVFNNGGTLTLDFSTTGHSTDSSVGNVGIEIKTGDNSRSLVGMVYPQSGPVVDNAGANLLVLSWFNRHNLSGINAFTATHSTSSATYVEIDSSIRIKFLTWGNEAVSVNVTGQNSGGANTFGNTSIAFDGTTPEDAQTTNSWPSGDQNGSVAIAYIKAGLSEGEHYATVLGNVSGSTGNWNGGASPGSRVAMTVGVRG